MQFRVRLKDNKIFEGDLATDGYTMYIDVGLQVLLLYTGYISVFSHVQDDSVRGRNSFLLFLQEVGILEK